MILNSIAKSSSDNNSGSFLVELDVIIITKILLTGKFYLAGKLGEVTKR